MFAEKSRQVRSDNAELAGENRNLVHAGPPFQPRADDTAAGFSLDDELPSAFVRRPTEKSADQVVSCFSASDRPTVLGRLNRGLGNELHILVFFADGALLHEKLAAQIRRISANRVYIDVAHDKR